MNFALVALRGTQSAVARRTDIQQSRLSRLSDGRLRRLGLDQFRRLSMSLSVKAHNRLHHALFSADTATAGKACGQWTVTKAALILKPVGRHSTTERGEPLRQAKLAVVQDGRRASLDALNSHVRQTFPDSYDHFSHKADRFRVKQSRCRLTVLRRLEPLVEDYASRLKGRRWTEPSDAELRSFVDAGLKRETAFADARSRRSARATAVA